MRHNIDIQPTRERINIELSLGSVAYPQWGFITGDITQQTDLNDALTEIDGKADTAQTTADRAENTAEEALAGLTTKVDKVAGKGLSTNDYTDEDKQKVADSANTNYVDSAIDDIMPLIYAGL